MASRLRYLTIGTVGKGHGLKGEVGFNPAVPDVDFLLGIKILRGIDINGEVRNLELEGVRTQGRKLLLAFKGVNDRDQADALRGIELAVNRDALPPLDEDEYYLGDLVGYTVVDDQQQVIGIVEDALDLPANAVLQVARGRRPVLIPVIDDVVRKIDHDRGRIEITVLEGLLD